MIHESTRIIPCLNVLESLALTYECSCFCSLTLTKRSIEIKKLPFRPQLDLPSQPLFLNNLTSQFNGLIHSYNEINNHIIPIDLLMKKVYGGVNKPWNDMGLLLHEYNLTLVLNIGVTKFLLNTHLILSASLFRLITKHKVKKLMIT